MHKIIITLCMILLIQLAVNAETKKVQKMEGGAFIGLTIPIESYHGGTAKITGDFGLEGRYNLVGTPWDFGLQLALYTAMRGYDNLFNDKHNRWQNNRTLALAAVSDYNVYQGNKVNPFVGCALGIGFNDVVGDRYFPTKGTSCLVAPRFGVELWHHLRLTAQINICRKGYNNFSLSIGAVIGGRPKK